VEIERGVLEFRRGRNEGVLRLTKGGGSWTLLSISQYARSVAWSVRCRKVGTLGSRSVLCLCRCSFFVCSKFVPSLDFGIALFLFLFDSCRSGFSDRLSLSLSLDVSSS